MSGFELSLLLEALEGTEPTDTVLQKFREGSFTELLSSPDLTETLLLYQQDLWQSWDLDIIAAEISLNLSTQRKCESALVAVACALNIFTQTNWTGPPVEQTSMLCNNEEQRKRCLESLSVCGCEPYHLLCRPELLFISRVLLEGCQQHLSRFPSLVLWRLRYCYLYQSVLDEPCTHLFKLLHSCLTLTDQTTHLLQSSAQLSVEYYLTAAGVYYCYHHTTEMSQMVQRARDVIKLNVELVGAMGKRTYWQESRPQLALKVNADWCNQVSPTSTAAAPTSTAAAPISTTVAPISTTVAPTDIPTTAAPTSTASALTSTTAAPTSTDTAPTSTTDAPTSTTDAPTSTTAAPISTTVAPTSTASAPTTTAGRLWTGSDCTTDVSPPLLQVSDLSFEEFECQHLPVDVLLQDDTRRPRIEYTDLEHAPMSSLQQAVVLNMFFLEQRSQGRDTIRDEQLMVMLNSLTQQPRVWSLQLAALLQRCGLESDARRTVERAMVQTQGLLDAVDAAQPPLRCRLQLFHCCRPPTRWDLQRELAARFLGLGLVKSALDIYERLELWDDAIRCYHHLQQRQRAEQVVRRLIGESGESARLLCLLGDATDDVTCYQRAWDMSGQKYWRAIRSQGLYYYHRKQYDVCIPLLRRAADLNGLQSDVWTRLAYAALQEKDWTLCAAAYRRCCVLEPDNYEAWNNIARAYVQLGQKERAWKTLQEALRFSFDNCKIWENFLLVSVDIGEFEEALNAYNRLSEIGEKHVDSEVLCILTDAVLQNNRDRHGNPASRLRPKLTALINRVTTTVTSSGVVWRLHGDLASAAADSCPAGDRLVPVTSYQRALRCSVLQSHWYQQTESCRQALIICHKLLGAALDWEKMSRDLENDSKLVAMLSSVKMSVHSSITKIRSVQSMGPNGDAVELRDDLSLCDRLLKQIIATIESRQS